MAKERLEYTIRKDGTVEEKVEGIPGPKCVELTVNIEEALGPVVERVYTAEYFPIDLPDSDKIKKSEKARQIQID